MPTADRVLEIARSQLGVSEQPPGSNRTPYGVWYGLNGYAWCAMFVSWVLDRAGALDVPRFAYTPTGVAHYRAAGRWHTTPRRGDVVFFRWPSLGRVAHVGFVESVGDGYVITIEGNTDEAGGRTGGKVMRRRRAAHIEGYGRPIYAQEDDVTPEDIEAIARRAAELAAPKVAEAVAKRLGWGDRSYEQDAVTQRVALRGLLDSHGLPIKHSLPDEYGV